MSWKRASSRTRRYPRTIGIRSVLKPTSLHLLRFETLPAPPPSPILFESPRALGSDKSFGSLPDIQYLGSLLITVTLGVEPGPEPLVYAAGFQLPGYPGVDTFVVDNRWQRYLGLAFRRNGFRGNTWLRTDVGQICNTSRNRGRRGRRISGPGGNQRCVLSSV